VTTSTQRSPATTDNLTDLLDTIDVQWRSEFARFVETGEADDGLLTYLDENEGAQKAVERAFNHQASKFVNLAAELHRRQDQNVATASSVSASSTTPTKIAAVVEGALQATTQERAKVVAASTAALVASMPAEEAAVVKQVARSLENDLAKVAEVS